MTQYFCSSFLRLCFWRFRGLDTQEVNPPTRNTSVIFFNWNLRLPLFNTELYVSLEQQRERGLLCFLRWLILITKGKRGCCCHEGQGEAHLQLRKSSRTHSGSTESSYKTQWNSIQNQWRLRLLRCGSLGHSTIKNLSLLCCPRRKRPEKGFMNEESYK